MSIKLNGTTFNNGGTAKYNSTSLQEIKYGSTTVWKAEKDFLSDATVSNKGVNVGSYGKFYTNCSGSTNINSTTIYIPADLTGIKNIVLKGTTTRTNSNSYAGAFLAASTGAIERYPYYTIGLGSDSSKYEKMSRHSNTSGSFTWTWDVSSLSGTHYICLGAYFNTNTTGQNGAAGITVTSAIGTY